LLYPVTPAQIEESDSPVLIPIRDFAVAKVDSQVKPTKRNP